MQKFKIIGKPLLGEKYFEGKRRIKSSSHYVRQLTHNVRAHELRSDQCTDDELFDE